METADLITKLVGNLGFPIFVAIFMLVKSSKETKALTEAINTLAARIDAVLGRVDDEHK